MIGLLLLAAATQNLAAADSLLATGDTSGALDAYEALVRRDWYDAEARYRAAELLMRRHRPGSDRSPPRRRAEEHLRIATRVRPDSAKYHLALAALFRGATEMGLRAQVGGLLERAYALSAQDPARRAEAADGLARLAFDRYEHTGHRYLLTDAILGLDMQRAMETWEYVEEFLTHARPDPDDPGGGDRMQAELYLDEVLAARPEDLATAGRLAVLLLDADRAEQALDMARRLTRALPDSGRAWALLGTALVRLDRWREAARAFDRALAAMTPAERAPYDDVALFLRRADLRRMGTMNPEQQHQLAGLYWREVDPLFLTEYSEPRDEFFARLTYALHRWSDPARALSGEQSDRGAVYIRYGPPDVWATLRGTGSQGNPIESLEHERTTVLWLYRPSRLRFVFSITSGYNTARFGGDFQALYQEAREVSPVRFDNVPAMARLDTVLVQAVQFRGGSRDSTDLALFGTIPVGRMGAADVAVDSQAIETLALVRDSLGREVARRYDIAFAATRAPIRHHSWRLALAPRTYLARIEAALPAVERGARWSGPLAIRSYDTRAFTLSDVLLARRLAPQDSAPARWTDFFIEPSAGRVEPGEAVSLLWEQYNLTPAADGIARWHVELRVTVTAVERRDFLARIVGGIGDAMGASAVGSDRVTLSWDREDRVAQGGTLVEWVTLDFGDAPAGSYTITVAVTDRIGGRTVERAATLVRSAREVER